MGLGLVVGLGAVETVGWVSGMMVGGVGLEGVPQADGVGVAFGGPFTGLGPALFPVPMASFIVLFIDLVWSLMKVWTLPSFAMWHFSTAFTISK